MRRKEPMMPKTEPNPRGLQEAANQLRLAKESPYVREDGQQVSVEAVPAKARERLDAARSALIDRISSDYEFAEKIDAAVRAEDAEATVRVVREAGVPSDIELKVVEIEADARWVIRGCIFGFCCSCTFTW